jgi:ferredoxin
MKSKINKSKCIGCGACTSVCPVEALFLNESGKSSVDLKKCIGCGACTSVCPVGAIDLVNEE